MEPLTEEHNRPNSRVFQIAWRRFVANNPSSEKQASGHGDRERQAARKVPSTVKRTEQSGDHMNESEQTESVGGEAFDLSPAGLEEAVAKAAALFVSIYRGLEERPVAPPMDRTALRAAIARTVADEGVGLVQALEDFEQRVLPGSMGTPHPLYLGLVNSSPLPGAALADLLISALNNNGGAFHQSPAMTACEEEVVRLFLELFGFTAGSDGVILPGGSLANLQALVLARSRAFPDGELRRPRVYTSEAAHFSVTRAAYIAGIPETGVIAIPTRGRGEMIPEALTERIRHDR